MNQPLPTRSESQLLESLDRYRHGFWARASGVRPPVSVVDEGVFLPIHYLRQPPDQPLLEPSQITPELIQTDYEYDTAHRTVFCDDWIPFSAAWRGIPWLEAWCGCPVRYATGSLAPDPTMPSLEALAEAAFPRRPDWLECLRRQTEWLARSVPPDCWVSPTILRGPSDVLGALRGLTAFYCDLYDAPALLERLAGRIQDLMLQSLDEHFAVVQPKRGGYGHIFGYWAPEKTICLQEDALGMCRPAIYRDLFAHHTARAVAHLGGCVLFHLHTTGFQHYRDVLRVPGLAGLQFTVESNGPPLRDLVPVFREVLEHSRLMLLVDAWFEQLPEVLQQIPHDGLCLLLNRKFLPSAEAYQDFVRRAF